MISRLTAVISLSIGEKRWPLERSDIFNSLEIRPNEVIPGLVRNPPASKDIQILY